MADKKITDLKANDANVFVCLMNECANYGWLFKDRYTHETKYAVNNFLSAGKLLQRAFEKVICVDDLSDLSENIAKMIDLLRKGDDKRFTEIMTLIKEYDAGNVKIIEDDNDKNVVNDNNE